MWLGTVQRALDVNSLQLMLKQMPLSAAILLPVIILAEDVAGGAEAVGVCRFYPAAAGRDSAHCSAVLLCQRQHLLHHRGTQPNQVTDVLPALSLAPH